MDAGSASAAVPRRLAKAVSPVVFQRVALAAVGVLILIVATGATVRLTGSGLGCPEWPTCTTKHALPQSYHSYIEFSNRVVSAITVFTTLALAVAAWLHPRALAPRQVARHRGLSWESSPRLRSARCVVYYDLNPYLVISHLLLSLIVLGLAVLALLEATRLRARRSGRSAAGWRGRAAWHCS